MGICPLCPVESISADNRDVMILALTFYINTGNQFYPGITMGLLVNVHSIRYLVVQRTPQYNSGKRKGPHYCWTILHKVQIYPHILDGRKDSEMVCIAIQIECQCDIYSRSLQLSVNHLTFLDIPIVFTLTLVLISVYL